jgi:hypothetical protein
MESQQLMFMLTGYGSQLKDDMAQNEFKDTIGKMISPIDPNDTATEISVAIGNDATAGTGSNSERLIVNWLVPHDGDS